MAGLGTRIQWPALSLRGFLIRLSLIRTFRLIPKRREIFQRVSPRRILYLMKPE